MRKIWPFSYYFLYFAALSAMAPFAVLLYQEIGLSGAQIGLLTGLQPLVFLLAAPFWTGWADARRIHRVLMSAAIVGSVLLVLLFPRLDSWAGVLVVIPLFSFFFAPIVPFADTATMSALAVQGQAQMYGRVRLGGTLGWALFAPVVGALVEAGGLDMAWYTFAVLMSLGLIVAQWFRFPTATVRVSLAAGLRTIRRSRAWLYFLAVCFVAGMGFAAVNSYLYAYMKELGASATLMGLALTISTVAEVPIMFFGNRLLARWGSKLMFVLAVAATGIRILLYAIFASPAGVLAFQLLNGFTFPMAWIAGVAWSNEHAPENMEATAQGAFSGMTTGFGSAAGGLLAGLLFGALGGRGMYYVMGAVVLTALAGIMLLERVTER